MNDQQNETTLSPQAELALDAMERPDALDADQLAALAADAEGLALCQTKEDAARVLAAQRTAMPDVDEEWRRFSSRCAGQATATTAALPQAPRARRRPLWWVTAAAAAVLALLVYVWNRPSGPDAALQAGAEVAEAPQPAVVTLVETVPDGGQVTLSSPKRRCVVPARADGYQTALAALAADETETLTITIPRGQVYATTLPDGTRVWLNADSRLLYPSTFQGSAERRVRLEGEAYFDVVSDGSHPFVVEAGQAQVRVLGTTFNVRYAAGADSHVTLVEGRVEVTRGARSAVLHPGQDALLLAQGGIEVQNVDVDDYVSWKDGRFYFDDADIEQILVEIGRWYNVTVKLENRDLLGYRFHFAADRSDSLSQVVELLNQMDKVVIRREGNTLFVR